MTAHPAMADLESAMLSFHRTARALERSYASLKRDKERIHLELEDRNRELKEKMQELDRAVRYLDTLLDGLSAGVVSADSGGRIRTLNRAAEGMFGCKEACWIGRPWQELRDARGRPVLRMERVGRTPERSVERPDGTRRVVRGEVSRVEDGGGGGGVAVIELLSDVTELRGLEEALAQKTRMAEMGEMASVLAHQIRNPLNGIAGFGNLILERMEPGDSRGIRTCARRVVEASRKLERLVSELLRLARDEPGIAADVDLGTLARETVREMFPGGCRRMRLLLPRRSIVAVRGDAVRLREALRNVLQNACDATREGEGGGRIRVQVAGDATEARIRVHDSGRGMEPEDLARVFRPFFTTKEEGFGLGLPIARKMVEALGGTIRIRSRPGRGCRVRITLPARSEE